MALYSGCGGTLLACNDDSCGLGSRITRSLDAGTRYLISVSGYAGARGTFALDVGAGPDVQAPNDSCQSAARIIEGVTAFGNTACASSDGTSGCEFAAQANDVWYEFSADRSGFYGARTRESSFRPVISVHSSCPTDLDSHLITCDNGQAGLADPRVVWEQQRGDVVWIRVGGFTAANGLFQLNVTTLPNDWCEEPANITDGSHSFSNIGASTDGEAGAGCTTMYDDNVRDDVWFRYEATCNGTVKLDTCGTPFMNKLAVYAGYECQPRELIACADNPCSLSQIEFPASFGQLFQIRVGGLLGQQGSGTLNISCSPDEIPIGCPWQLDGCFGDFNNDGGIDGDDVIGFFAEWDNNGTCADVNQDTSTDGDDVILFFNSWDNAGSGFPGC